LAPCAGIQPELAFIGLAMLLRGGMAKTSCPNFWPSFPARISSKPY